MDWTKIPAVDLLQATKLVLPALGDNAGMVIDRIIKDPSFVDKLVKFATDQVVSSS